MNDLTKPTPEEDTYRALKFLTKSVAQLVPGFGGTAAEFFDLVVSDPAVKRRDRFMMQLAGRLDEMAELQKFDPHTLLDNEEVSAFLLHAIQIAMRSQGERKLDALREAAAHGATAPNEEERSPAYVVLGILDRLTDYHIILLRWEAKPRRSYTFGQVKSGAYDSLHYGLPTVSDPSILKEPHSVFSFEGVNRYVEAQSHRNFRLAKFDLIALGLLEPVLRQEYAADDRRVQHLRSTPDTIGHKLSELGRFIVSYTEADEQAETDGPRKRSETV